MQGVALRVAQAQAYFSGPMSQGGRLVPEGDALPSRTGRHLVLVPCRHTRILRRGIRDEATVVDVELRVGQRDAVREARAIFAPVAAPRDPEVVPVPKVDVPVLVGRLDPRPIHAFV